MSLRLLKLIIFILFVVKLQCLANQRYNTEYDYCLDLRKSIIHEKEYYQPMTYTHLTKAQKKLLNKTHSTNIHHFMQYHCSKLLHHKIH